MKLTEILLFCTMMFVGHYAIKYKVKLNDITKDKKIFDSLYQTQKDISLNLSLEVFKLDSLRTYCNRCSKYPVYELNN